MAFQEDEFEITLRSIVDKDVWDVKFRIKGYEPTTKGCHWNIGTISWKTYNEKIGDDVSHFIVDVWLKTAHADVFELIDLVKEVVLGPA